jgi:hypothetical protein
MEIGSMVPLPAKSGHKAEPMRISLPSQLAGNGLVRAVGNFCALVAAITWIGCQPGGPSAIQVPSVDPSVAAKRALDLYDKDDSGALDARELAACPGLLAARERYDANHDGQISGDEIAARLDHLYSSGVGLTTVSCRVFVGTQPIAGAKLRFVPEPFLGSAVMTAVGTTDDNGGAIIAIADEALPADQRALRSMQPGIYRVRIEHPSIKRPAAPLGCEIDPISRGGTEPVFRL